MKNIIKNIKGITLISLVVTIVILLILASVTLNMALSDKGIFNMAKKATESYQIASEREYLVQNILSVQSDKYLEDSTSEKLGETLNEKNLADSSNWHIIKVDGTTYDTGWNFISKGTNLPSYGKAICSWLINYETGEIIELKEDNYMNLSPGDMLAIRDSLIINVDSSIIDNNLKNDKASLEKQLGEGVTLENFNYTAESGLTSTSFNFDGVNEYIKIQYDKKEQKVALSQHGFTFEFYGIWNGGTSYDSKNQVINYPAYKGLFCYWNPGDVDIASFRFGIRNSSAFSWNAGYSQNGKHISDWSRSTSPHNIDYDLSNNFQQGNTCYITVTLDTSNIINKDDQTYYNQRLYINGKDLLYNGNYNTAQWNDFINNYLTDSKYFCIGRSTMDDDGNGNPYWHYSKLNVYCLRLYSRALSDSEVYRNYEKSVEYHSLSTE